MHGSCVFRSFWPSRTGMHAVDAREHELIVSQWMLGANQEMVELSLLI